MIDKITAILSKIFCVILFINTCMPACAASKEDNLNKISSAQSEPTTIHLSSFNLDIEAISRINNKLFIVGQSGFIAYSENNGKTWIRSDADTSSTLKSIAHNSEQLIVVGLNGAISRSINEGKSWQSVNASVSTDLNSIAYISGNKFIAVGNKGVITITQDGGKSWKPVVSGVDKDFIKIAFSNESSGFAIGNNGTLLRTDNGGNNWNAVNTGVTSNLSGITFYDGQQGTIVGEGVVLNTVDRGTTWQVKETRNKCWLKNVAYLDALNLVAVGYACMLRSYDGGQSWPHWFNVFNSPLKDVSRSGSSLFLVGQAGAILEKKDNDPNWEVKRRNKELIEKIGYSDGKTIIASARTNQILRSVDGGLNWEQSSLECQGYITGLYFRNLDVGLAVCSNELFRSGDQGRTWQSIFKKGYFQGAIDTADEKNIIALSRDGVYLSKDGGLSWSIPSLNAFDGLQTVKYLDKNNVLVTGNHSSVWRSADGGETWKSVTNGLRGYGHFWGMDTFDGQKIIVVDSEGNILISKDAGYSWRLQSNGHNGFGQVIFLDADHVVALGSKSLVYSDDGGASWHKSELPSGLRRLYLGPNYSFSGGRWRVQPSKSVDFGKIWQDIYVTPIPIGVPFEIPKESQPDSY